MSAKVLKSSLIISVLLVGEVLLSFFKEGVIASCFGVSRETDAFAIALQVPVMLFAFFAVSIRSVILPLYSKKVNGGTKEEADSFISNFFSIAIVFGLVFVLLGELGAGIIIKLLAPGFDDYTHSLAVELIRITFPSVVFTLVINIFTAVLHVKKVFFITELSNYVLNTVIIICILLLYKEDGIAAAAVGQFLGLIVQVTIISICAKKYVKLRWVFNLKDESIRKSFRMSLPVMWSSGISEVNSSVSKIVASYLVAGSITALNYATKINSVFFTFSTYAISVMVFPIYAEASSTGDYKKLNNVVNLSISLYSFLLIPLSCLLAIFKYDIVKLAFARGKFVEEDVLIIQSLFGIYIFSIVFMALRETITRVFHSLQDTKTPAKNATFGVIINIVLNLTLPLIFGVYGLAFATLITSIFISTRLFFQLKQKRDDFEFSTIYQSMKKSIIASLIMTAVVLIMRLTLPLTSVLLAIISGLTGILVYLLLQYLMKQYVVTYLLGSFTKYKKHNLNS